VLILEIKIGCDSLYHDESFLELAPPALATFLSVVMFKLLSNPCPEFDACPVRLAFFDYKEDLLKLLLDAAFKF
jgi:hypothetical protein